MRLWWCAPGAAGNTQQLWHSTCDPTRLILVCSCPQTKASLPPCAFPSTTTRSRLATTPLHCTNSTCLQPPPLPALRNRLAVPKVMFSHAHAHMQTAIQPTQQRHPWPSILAHARLPGALPERPCSPALTPVHIAGTQGHRLSLHHASALYMCAALRTGCLRTPGVEALQGVYIRLAGKRPCEACRGTLHAHCRAVKSHSTLGRACRLLWVGVPLLAPFVSLVLGSPVLAVHAWAASAHRLHMLHGVQL